MKWKEITYDRFCTLLMVDAPVDNGTEMKITAHGRLFKIHPNGWYKEYGAIGHYSTLRKEVTDEGEQYFEYAEDNAK